ncbi:MAG: hypothetical protein HY784_06365 [Chloroflexi bacterium]|nr:hypothetical protein [Chloroflexota bacterium]
MIGRPVAQAAQADVTDPQAVARVLDGADAALSAVPYVHNLNLTSQEFPLVRSWARSLRSAPRHSAALRDELPTLT